MSKLTELMTEFAEKFGVEGLVAGLDGVYRLDADDMSLAIADAEDGMRFAIWAEVCPVPSEGREWLYGTLLQAMFMGRKTSGAYFSINDETIYLHQVETLSDMGLERFKDILEMFINTYLSWRSAIANFDSVLPDLNPKDPTPQTPTSKASDPKASDPKASAPKSFAAKVQALRLKSPWLQNK